MWDTRLRYIALNRISHNIALTAVALGVNEHCVRVLGVDEKAVGRRTNNYVEAAECGEYWPMNISLYCTGHLSRTAVTSIIYVRSCVCI